MNFTDLNSAYAHIKENASEAFASKELCDFIQKKISEANDIYVASQEAKAEAEAKLSEAFVAAAEAQEKTKALEARVLEMETTANEKAIQDIFDARFSALAEKYNLEDPKLRTLIAKQIKDLDEEGFEFWSENDGLLILASREKQKPSVSVEDATEALKEAKASSNDLPNSQDLTEKKEYNILDLHKEISISTSR